MKGIQIKSIFYPVSVERVFDRIAHLHFAPINDHHLVGKVFGKV